MIWSDDPIQWSDLMIRSSDPIRCSDPLIWFDVPIRDPICDPNQVLLALDLR